MSIYFFIRSITDGDCFLDGELQNTISDKKEKKKTEQKERLTDRKESRCTIENCYYNCNM